MSEGTQRRLAAIVAADVVGYSRLMGVNEAGTLAALRSHRAELIDDKIAEHGGRIVKTMGDGLLLEFPSVVDATQCVIDVQQAMARRNEAVDEDKRIVFRIGVHLGDLVVEGDDIFGDGINIAARLEAICEVGGVAISGTAHENIAGRIEVGFIDAGEQQLKNISRPVRVWQWTPTASQMPTTREVLALSDKPSIAVLAFENMSGDPEQEYFSDGMTEDIITALSKFRWFFVSARNSSFAYKGAVIDIKQIGRELNVRYVLEGSVRKAGNRIRITAQLIDTATGNHIWAERYDRDLEDIFDLQDEIQQAIVTAVEPELVSAEYQRSSSKTSSDLAAWDLLQQAMWHLNQRTISDTECAVALFESAIARDPSMARAYAGYSRALVNQTGYGWSASPQEHLRKAKDLALEAIRKDDGDPFNHDALGRVFNFLNEAENAIREHQIAMKLNPNSAYTHFGLAEAFWIAGRNEEGLAHVDVAIRLSPRDPMMFLFETIKGICLEGLDRLAEAEQALLRGDSLRPDMTIMFIADYYARHGRMAEARKAVENALEQRPDLSISSLRNVVNPYYLMHGDDLLKNLRAAGLPEE